MQHAKHKKNPFLDTESKDLGHKIFQAILTHLNGRKGSILLKIDIMDNLERPF